MARRTHRIVVKCHLDELKTIQAKATSLGQESATYLRELGIRAADPDSSEDLTQRQLYWLAGTLHDLLNSWGEQPVALPQALADSMQLTIKALRVLQQEALLDKLPPHLINASFTQAIAQVRHANQNHQGQ